MAQNPLIKRYLDAGMAFTAMTQARAEAIVKDLVRTGEVQAQRGEELVSQIVERSRRNSDKLLDVVRNEVRNQVSSLGLATKEDVARLEKEVADAKAEAAQAAKKAGQAQSAAKKKPGAKRPGTKKSGTTKAATTKAATKKTTARKSAPRAAKRTGGATKKSS